MNTNHPSWPLLLLLVAGSVAAGDQEVITIKVPNIPPGLMPPAETAVEVDSVTDESSPPCEEVDCFPTEQSSAPPPPLAKEKITLRATPPTAVRIGSPAQRAIVQSHDWAENPSAMPKLDSGGRVVFQFSESAPTIVCAPLRVCDIELQPGEAVQGAPHIGDGVRWKIGPAVSGSDDARVTHLIVKPTEANLDTNLIVPTDRRTYHLRLVSSDHQYVSSVAFDYPDDQRLAWNALSKANISGGNQTSATEQDLPRVAVNRLNFNYKIKVVKGKPSFKPLRAMDDGYHTYIAMNDDLPQKEAPALIGISPDGNEQMINYRLKGNLYVVDGSVHKLALISGVGGDQQRIELTRNACAKRGWLGICWDSKE